MKKRKQGQAGKDDFIMAQAIYLFYINLCKIYWHKLKNELLKLAKMQLPQDLRFEMLDCTRQFEAMALKDLQRAIPVESLEFSHFLDCLDKQGTIPLGSFVKVAKARTYHWAWMWNKIGYWHGLAKGGGVALALHDMKKTLQSLVAKNTEATEAANAAFNRGKEALDQKQCDQAGAMAAECDLGAELQRVNSKWFEVYSMRNHDPHITEQEMANRLGISQSSVHTRLDKLRKWLTTNHPGMTVPGDYARRKTNPAPRRKNLPLQESDAPTIPDPDHGGPSARR